VDSESVESAPPRHALIGIAVVATVLVLAVYAFAVRSASGQRLDAAALKGRRVLSRSDIHLAARLHHAIDVASLLLLGSAIVLVALVRGRPRLALTAGIIIAGSLATTETLKRVLARPHLGVADALKGTPTYPSGHTTIAMALCVAAIIVVPRRLRGVVAVPGVVFASVVGCSVVATASHRPSDPIGAAFVVTAWSASVVAVLVWSDAARTSTGPTWLHSSPWMAAGGVALLTMSFVVVAITTFSRRYGHLDTVEFGRAFIAAGSAIVGTILSCAAALLIALHNTDLDQRPRRGNGHSQA